MKQLNRVLNCIIGGLLGTFLGRGIWLFWDYRINPEIYALYSAPWYYELIFYGITVTALSCIILTVKYILRKKLK